MKEIQFRGYVASEKRWAFGFPFKNGENWFIYESKRGCLERTPIVNDSLGEGTGLKDNSRKMIFEGDIYREMRGGKDAAVGLVVFKNGAFRVDFGKLGSYVLGDRDEYAGKIIGNNYENPELTQ